MSLDTKLYYCLCIEANRFRYSTYGREANRTLKTIQVPVLHHVPSWVSGAAKAAVSEFSKELMGLVETGEETTIAYRRATLPIQAALKTHQQAGSTAASTAALELRQDESAEDRRGPQEGRL
jgi:hypothetical protein